MPSGDAYSSRRDIADQACALFSILVQIPMVSGVPRRCRVSSKMCGRRGGIDRNVTRLYWEKTDQSFGSMPQVDKRGVVANNCALGLHCIIIYASCMIHLFVQKTVSCPWLILSSTHRITEISRYRGQYHQMSNTSSEVHLFQFHLFQFHLFQFYLFLCHRVPFRWTVIYPAKGLIRCVVACFGPLSHETSIAGNIL